MVVALGLVLAGCQQDLYTNLPESEANQMLAVLLANGVPAEKRTVGKEGFTVSVDSKDMLRGIAVLNDNGFPKSTRESIGKVFQKSGIMSSPFEERVRFIYALGEEVAGTLAQIDGVVAARVHIVLPDAPQIGQPIRPSSAAVFIKHQPGVDLDFFVPQIRRLVSSSIEGLEYSAVTVVLADAQPTKASAPVAANAGVVEVLPGLAVREADKSRFWQLGMGAAGVAGALLLTNVLTLIALVRSRRLRKGGEGSSVALVEPS